MTQPEWTAVTGRARQILQENFGPSLRLGDIERLSDDGRRNLLLRLNIKANDTACPPSIILKQTMGAAVDAEMTEADRRRALCDLAGVAFLDQIAPEARLSPRFYGLDADLNFVLMEDYGREHHSLVDPLLHSDATTATNALTSMMRHLGQVHAAAFGRLSTYENILSGLHPAGVALVSQTRAEADLTPLFTRLADWVEVTDAFQTEAEQVHTAVSPSNPFFTFVHGDPCPDNWFVRGDNLHLIDFEVAHFGHALQDAAYLRMNFPSCWCANRVPTAVIAAGEAAYRAAFAPACPSVLEDALFNREMTVACARWLLMGLARLWPHVQDADNTWGIASVRARLLAFLAAFVDMADQSNHLPAMRNTAVALHTILQNQWPEVVPLPVYPAFQTGETDDPS